MSLIVNARREQHPTLKPDDCLVLGHPTTTSVKQIDEFVPNVRVTNLKFSTRQCIAVYKLLAKHELNSTHLLSDKSRTCTVARVIDGWAMVIN